ncbi:MAG: UDP-N-acetylmuramate dehydrogenase [Oscillospiraceae bacterium]|nr:UDP-N-acetylmuramate dehydrogenase [Oscillospiraceae bacterium]
MDSVKNYTESERIVLLEDVSLKKYTSFKLGGTADFMVFPQQEEQVAEILRLCRSEKIPFFIIGNGSNLLAPDEGFPGVIISTEKLDTLRLECGNKIYCGAGVKLKTLCQFALEHSLTGLEFAYGIPGTAGGAAFMNAGAYGGEMKDVLAECKYIGEKGNITFSRGDELKLGYRHSVFAENSGIILELCLELQRGNHLEIHEKMQDFMGRRRDKQPLEYPSAGSVFKRPAGDFAGRLIEQCGLKGYQIGGAQVSEKHSGFIINRGGATCADVLALVEHVRKTVHRETGVLLESEIRTLQIPQKSV